MDRKLQRARTLTEQAADEIRARIIRGNFQLGEALSENTLAAELGVSKTPVREALLQLKLEGLVDIQPQRGSFVFQMSAQEVIELSELREILETAAALRSLERDPKGVTRALTAIVDRMKVAIDRGDFPAYRDLDAEFHQTLVDHCGNEFLKESFAGITFRVQALRTRLSVDSALNSTSLDEHDQILARLKAGDAAGLRDVLCEHIFGTKRLYVETLGSQEPALAKEAAGATR
jgi:DNA-binding GntR family transcriptional regulator